MIVSNKLLSVFKHCCLLFSWLHLSGDLQAQPGCQVRIDRDGIKVATCHSDTSVFKSISAEFMMKATLQQFQDFMLDFPNYQNWQFNTIESRMLTQITDAEFIIYTKIEAPWPVADRDMVVRFTTERKQDQLIITANSIKGRMPEQKGFVRVPASHSQWIITTLNDDTLFIKYQMQIDPGGSVPVWLANWVCAQGPYQSFKKLKATMGKKK